MELNNVIKRTNAIFVLHEYKFIISISQTWCVTIFDRVWTLHNQIRVIGLNSEILAPGFQLARRKFIIFILRCLFCWPEKKTRFLNL